MRNVVEMLNNHYINIVEKSSGSALKYLILFYLLFLFFSILLSPGTGKSMTLQVLLVLSTTTKSGLQASIT